MGLVFVLVHLNLVLLKGWVSYDYLALFSSCGFHPRGALYWEGKTSLKD